MNKITRAVIVGAMGISMTFAAVLPALAETGGLRDRVKDKVEQKKEKIEKKITAVCEAVNKRIDAKVNNYNERKDLHIKKYQMYVARWTELAGRLDEAGMDTTKLRTDLKTMDGMIKQSAADYAAFIAKIEETKNYDCSESKGLFKESLSKSRTDLASFRDQSSNIANFVKNTIMPDLKALRVQKPINKTVK